MNETLQSLRRSAGFETQESFATSVGCTRDAVAQWEIGAAYPRTILIPRIAKALSVTEGEVIAAVTASKQNTA